MGIKDMFRTGSKHSQDSPTPSAKPSPKTSRAGTPLRETRDDVSVASRASSSGMPSREEQAGEKGRSEDKGASDKVTDLEKELSNSRWEAMMMRDKIAELEHKLETAQMPGGWAPFPSEEQRAKEEALEERNAQLREKVRDLQEELERLQEGNSQRSSDDQSAGTDASAKRGSEPAHEARSKDDEGKRQMAVRIQELEAKLEEHQSSVFGENFVGLQARIKTLEEQLRESREDMDEVLKERNELKEALQDADDRLEAVEAAGAENKMHSISRQKVIEMELVETKEKLKRAEMAAEMAERAFEELRRRKDFGSAPGKERQSNRKSVGRQNGKEIDDAGATSADTVSDFEDDSEVAAPPGSSEHSRGAQQQRAGSKNTDRRIVPKEAAKSPQRGSDPAQQLRAMFDESDNSRQNSPKGKNGGHTSHAPRETKCSAGKKFLPSPDVSQRESALSLSQSEAGGNSVRVHAQEVREGHLQALEAERSKNKLLEMKVAAYEKRIQELETSFQSRDLSSSGYRHSPGSILDRTDKWVSRRKVEPEDRTREEIEEDIFKEKVELAKSKLKGASSPKVPDLGKLYAWEKPSPKPKKKGVSLERPVSPPQRKHFDAILQSQVKQSRQGIAGPQPPTREAVQSLKTSRSWNPTQLQGSTYGFVPTVEETPPPRVNIIAPDKVTGNDKAPWLVECHPEHDEKELYDQGVGRSKKLFPGQGFKEGITWPETKEPEVKTYQQRQDIYETRGHYKGAPVVDLDAAGCPSSTPSGANIKIFRAQYGDIANRCEWYDGGAKGIKTAYEGHVACTTNSTDTGRKGKMLSQTKIAQLSGPSPFGLDTQGTPAVQENWNMDRSPAPFGRDDQVDRRRKAWAPT